MIKISSITDPSFSLQCLSEGVPGFISWAFSGSSKVYTNDEVHKIVQTLINGTSSTIESTLSFSHYPYQKDTGDRSCKVTTTYVSTNNSETNTSTITGWFSSCIIYAIKLKNYCEIK